MQVSFPPPSLYLFLGFNSILISKWRSGSHGDLNRSGLLNEQTRGTSQWRRSGVINEVAMDLTGELLISFQFLDQTSIYRKKRKGITGKVVQRGEKNREEVNQDDADEWKSRMIGMMYDIGPFRHFRFKLSVKMATKTLVRLKTGAKILVLGTLKTVPIRSVVIKPSGALVQQPKKVPFGLIRVILTVIPGLLIGASISKTIANFLEENDLFVPSDDDDDDDD